MKVHIEILTPEGAVVAARVAAAIAVAMNGEGTVSTSTRTRRTAAQIATDKAAEEAAAKAAANPPTETKPDAVEQYLAMTGDAKIEADTKTYENQHSLIASSAQPDTAKPSNPAPDTAAGPVDPMAAMLAAAVAETKPAATGKTRDEMIAAVVKLMSEKGVPWSRENIVSKYKVMAFKDASDDLVNQMYVENCV